MGVGVGDLAGAGVGGGSGHVDMVSFLLFATMGGVGQRGLAERWGQTCISGADSEAELFSMAGCAVGFQFSKPLGLGARSAP